ncbi:MAG: pilus assembly protein PilM [Patescibacteria group bacterium]
MAKNVIGIDISDYSIEALSLEKSRGSFVVESYSRFRLSPEIVEDGRVLNPQKLKEAILKLFQNAKPRPFDQSHKVFLSIPESKTFSQVLSLPKNIKDKDIVTVASNQAEELIPESINNLTAVVKILPDTENSRQVFYSAVETDVLKSFVTLFDELNIGIAGITTEASSSFAGLKRDKDKKLILLLDLGARTTIASIFREEYLCSSININIGGDNITKALAKKLNIPYTQAEEKKIQIGLNSDGDGETMLISQGQLQPLVDELKVFIKYWQESSGQTIEQVILIGGLAQMKGIDKYFSDDLALPTQLGQPFIDIKNLPEGLVFSKYINALGLAKLAHQDVELDFYKKLSKETKTKDVKIFKEGDKPEAKISKFSKKTLIYMIVAICLLLSAIALLVFRNQLTALFYRNTPQTESIKVVEPEPVPEEISGPLSFEEEVIVAINTPAGVDNFILGEYYNLEFKKVSTPNAGLDYLQATQLLESQANQEIVTLLNNNYQQAGYYIIPSVFSYEVIAISATPENYKIEVPLEATIQYKFIMFSEQSIKDWLIKKYPYLESKINNLKYTIINYSVDASGDRFNMKVLINKDI